MAHTYKRDNPKGACRLAIVSFFIILLIALGFAVIVEFFGSDYVVQKSLEDPDVVLHVTVSGGDVIVTIYEGRRVNELQMLVLEIEGVPLPSLMSMMPAPEYGTGIVYFSNSSLLKLNTIQFT